MAGHRRLKSVNSEAVEETRAARRDDRFSGGWLGGEVRARRARRALDRQLVRPIHPRPLVFDLPARRGDRPGVSQQHGTVRRALPAGVLAGERGGRDARSAGSAASRRLPDVLGHRQPERVVGALADGDGRPTRSARRWPAGSASRSGSGDGSSPRAVPTLCAMAILPLVLYRVIGPEVRRTPEAPAAARQALAALGPLSRQERIVLVVFLGMVALWGSAATLGLDSTAIAFLGLGALLATGVITLDDIAETGRRARDVHLVRGALHPQQPAQRAGLHGIPGPETGRGPRRPGDCPPPASSWLPPTSCCTTCSSARRHTCWRSSASSSTSA